MRLVARAGRHAARGLPAGGARTITVRTESRNPAADALYARYGLRETFAEYVMRRRPRPAAARRAFPADVTQASWSPQSERLFLKRNDAAFRERPGFPGYSAEE